MSEPIISVTHAALAAGIDAAERSMPSETGGVLAGWRTADGIHVVMMLEVPSSKAMQSSYVRSQRRADAALRRYLKEQTPRSELIGYVGDWHSHPAPQVASRTDLASIAEFARNDGLPVGLLVLVRSEQWEPDGWHAAATGGRVRVQNAVVGTVDH